MNRDGSNRDGSRPPRLAVWILGRFASSCGKETIMGDLEEYYRGIRMEHGAGKAAGSYWSQAMSACCALAAGSIGWRMTMLGNNLVVARRNLKKDGVYSLINVTGLAIGLACAFLIAIWVIDETGYDRFHEDSGRIYRVNRLNRADGGSVAFTSVLLSGALNDDFAAVTHSAMVCRLDRKIAFRYEDRNFLEDRVLVSDNRFFDIFSVKFLRGSPETALNRPQTVVMSRKAASRYFGGADPIGKTIEIVSLGRNFEITGVVADCPANSHLQYDFIFTWDWSGYGWGSQSVFTYVKLAEGESPVSVAPLMGAFVEKNLSGYVKEEYGTDLATFMNDPDLGYSFDFQPITAIHLDDETLDNMPGKGDIDDVCVFSIAALFILIVACVNFINLSTARAGRRSREVGVRKVLGAGRKELVGQFLFESVLSSSASFLLAAALAAFALPYFNELTGKAVDAAVALSPMNSAALLSASLLAGLLAGAYPAFYLSSFRPAVTIKAAPGTGTCRSGMRDALVVFQYTVATIIFLSAFVIYSQSRYLSSARLGFDKELVLVVHGARGLGDRMDAMIRELEAIPGVVSVANSSSLPGGQFDRNGHRLEGAAASDETMICTMYSDARLDRTLGLKITRGRFFSDEIASDGTSAVVINETAARMLGLDDPVGKRFLKEYGGAADGEYVTIIGVLEDFHFHSLHEEIEPLVIRNLGGAPGHYLGVRLTNEGAANPAAVVGKIRETWKQFAVGSPFEYSFLDADFDALYRAEARTGRIMSTFFVLSVVIACLGLYGLVSFSTEQRTKEIGIRKVLGASVGDILVLLSRRIALLVVVANLIAWPAAYLIMDRWLENFAYKTGFTPWMPVISCVVGLFFAMLTVSHRAVAAARSNPVRNIRYE